MWCGVKDPLANKPKNNLLSRKARMKIHKTLMVQGTTSDAGKSVLVAGLCRLLQRNGVLVAPFKPQNMALNSAVTVDGGEIGRSQALQAQACGVEPYTDFNPVLLKPASDTGAQVIIHGKAIDAMQAQQFHDYKNIAMSAVLESYNRLSQQYDRIMVEGAGSPAEINLRENDIANMGFAEAVDCDVILVADIDRGGVFAHLVGTLDLLSESEQNRVIGFVINRFRGDISLLQSGLDWLEERTNKPVLGVVPYLQNFYLDAEDAICTHEFHGGSEKKLKVVVPVLPRISNHTDFDALRLHPQVSLQFVSVEQPCPGADLIVLPGSKNVRADLDYLIDNGWRDVIAKHLRYGGRLLGICGGYQMLGEVIHDPEGIEDSAGSTEALGYFQLETVLEQSKQLRNVSGEFIHARLENAPFTGYEIHCGSTSATNATTKYEPLLQVKIENESYPDGACSLDDQIIGTYIHGIFDHPDAMQVLLNWAGFSTDESVDINQIREQQLDRLADTLQEHLLPEFLSAIVE